MRNRFQIMKLQQIGCDTSYNLFSKLALASYGKFSLLYTDKLLTFFQQNEILNETYYITTKDAENSTLCLTTFRAKFKRNFDVSILYSVYVIRNKHTELRMSKTLHFTRRVFANCSVNNIIRQASAALSSNLQQVKK